jgi:hypothetical protein
MVSTLLLLAHSFLRPFIGSEGRNGSCYFGLHMWVSTSCGSIDSRFPSYKTNTDNNIFYAPESFQPSPLFAYFICFLSLHSKKKSSTASTQTKTPCSNHSTASPLIPSDLPHKPSHSRCLPPLLYLVFLSRTLVTFSSRFNDAHLVAFTGKPVAEAEAAYELGLGLDVGTEGEMAVPYYTHL